jgi:hypothetical protein
MKQPQVSFEGKVPKCFDSAQQFRAWKECARFDAPVLGVCADCTPEYQARMIHERRCENPQVQFEEGESGVVEGVIYKTLWYANKKARQRNANA